LVNVEFLAELRFFARSLHTRTAVARLPLRQLGFRVEVCYCLLSQLHTYMYVVSTDQ